MSTKFAKLGDGTEDWPTTIEYLRRIRKAIGPDRIIYVPVTDSYVRMIATLKPEDKNIRLTEKGSVKIL